MIAGISYQEAGAGVPVVCLHGIGGGAESFRPQLEGLSSPLSSSGALKELRVIAWDMPGYGESEAGAWTFEEMSARLAAFIEGIGGPVHLVGQSIGGMITLDHALRRPKQVRTLSLVGTTPAFGGRDDSFKDAFLKARLAPLEAGNSMAEMAAETAPFLVGTDCATEVIDEIAAIMAKVPEPTWRGILECLVTFNRRDDLGAVSQACCLISGDQDRNAPAKTMSRMAEKLPDAELHVLEGVGHMINQEAPDQTNAILAEFLGKHA